MKRKTAWAAMLAAGAALLGGGCFSVDVGPREWYSKEYFSGEETGRTVSVACTSVEASVDGCGSLGDQEGHGKALQPVEPVSAGESR